VAGLTASVKAARAREFATASRAGA
jgi:hypothetical protein